MTDSSIKTLRRRTSPEPESVLAIDAAPAFSVPLSAATLEGFIDWACSDRFPKQWSASFIGDEIYLDMSPEELETHVRLKAEISRQIHNLAKTVDLGAFYADRTLVANSDAGLSTEQILAYRQSDYVAVRPRRGWHRSNVFDREFHLRRERDRSGGWDYTLEIREL